jgi:glycosyltransferase involved in cell wall biosynthesis
VPFLYPVVSGGRVPFAGGIEVQLALLARGLAARGFDVSVVTCDYGQPDGLVVDGVRLLRAWRPDAGLPVVRFVHPRLTRSLRALLRADADVYVTQGAGMWAGIVRALARARGRRFLYVVAHDHDVMRALPDLHGWRDRHWYRDGLLGADQVVAQTEKQRALLREAFGRDSVVIMNPVEIPQPSALADPARSRRVVWVATYKPAKRPEWFTRFAERHPQVECVMAGVIPVPPLTDADHRAACEVAARCPNLKVLGTIPHERIGEFLREAALFTHTSPAEGFPNAFLEAWSHGLPTVTCFDPDGIIARERLGECLETFEAWEAAVVRWLADPAARAAAGARARAYASGRHGSGEVHDRFAAELDRLVAMRRATHGA